MTQLARFSLLLVALLVSGFPFGFTPAHADELPQDTNKIESLTPEQARKLAEEFPGVEVEFETDEEIGWWWSDGLPLQGLTTLNPKTAEELARFKGNAILLTGLSSLGVDTATSFAAYDGDVVVSEKVQKRFLATHPLSPESTVAWAVVTRGDLSRVPAIDLAIAKALAEFKGRELSLTGLTTLDADTAKALAATEKWDGDLSAVTALDTPDSVAIAKALATRKGPLKLPNLKKISPKTLSALIAKEDVAIPLIETRELIQEPDGSVTEDFVIPEGFMQQSR